MPPGMRRPKGRPRGQRLRSGERKESARDGGQLWEDSQVDGVKNICPLLLRVRFDRLKVAANGLCEGGDSLAGGLPIPPSI